MGYHVWWHDHGAGEAPYAITTLDEPNAMTAVFTRAAGDYVLKVTCDDAAGGAPKARTINLKAKYVRREIRTLHAGDLARYIFQPTNPDLPFVYHNLRWDHCPAADH